MRQFCIQIRLFVAFFYFLSFLSEASAAQVRTKTFGKNFRKYSTPLGSLLVSKLGKSKIVTFSNDVGTVREVHEESGNRTIYTFTQYPYNYILVIKRDQQGHKKTSAIVRPLNVSFMEPSEYEIQQKCFEHQRQELVENKVLSKILTKAAGVDTSCQEHSQQIQNALQRVQSEKGYLQRCFSSKFFLDHLAKIELKAQKDLDAQKQQVLKLMAVNDILLQFTEMETSKKKIEVSCKVKEDTGAADSDDLLAAKYIPREADKSDEIQLNIQEGSALRDFEIETKLTHELVHAGLQSRLGADSEEFNSQLWRACQLTCAEEKNGGLKDWNCRGNYDREQTALPMPDSVVISPDSPTISPSNSVMKAPAPTARIAPVATEAAQELDKANQSVTEELKKDPVVAAIKPLPETVVDRIATSAQGAVSEVVSGAVESVSEHFATDLNKVAGAMNRAVASTRSPSYNNSSGSSSNSISSGTSAGIERDSDEYSSQQAFRENFPMANEEQLHQIPMPTYPIDDSVGLSSLNATLPFVGEASQGASTGIAGASAVAAKSIAGPLKAGVAKAAKGVAGVTSAAGEVAAATGSSSLSSVAGVADIGAGAAVGENSGAQSNSGNLAAVGAGKADSNSKLAVANAQSSSQRAPASTLLATPEPGKNIEQEYISSVVNLTTVTELPVKEVEKIRTRTRDPKYIKMLENSRIAIRFNKPVAKVVGNPATAKYVFTDEDGRLKLVPANATK